VRRLIGRWKIEVIGDAPVVPLELLAERTGECDVTWSDPDRDEPRVILFTSGTTSRPKGVLHSLNTLTAGARNMVRVTADRPRVRVVRGAVRHREPPRRRSAAPARRRRRTDARYGGCSSARRTIRRGHAPRPGGGLHLGGPPLIEVTARDRAKTTRNLLFVDRRTGESRSAVYTDELVRTPAGWRIAHCRCQFIVADGLSDRPERSTAAGRET
jgi:hypothetical protein